jgi:hypothetical protein
MAQVNNGYAGARYITITKVEGGVTTPIQEDFWAAFGAFPALTQSTFQALTTTAINERAAAFRTYLNQKYGGLDVASIETNAPTKYDATSCPVGQ